MLCSWNTNVLKSPKGSILIWGDKAVTSAPMGPFCSKLLSNPCCPFKSLWETSRVQVCRKVDNKATPAITTEKWREREPQISAVHATILILCKSKCLCTKKTDHCGPSPTKHEAPPLIWGWSTAGDMKLPKTSLNRVHRWELSCAIR